jgi:hypothetical protein
MVGFIIFYGWFYFWFHRHKKPRIVPKLVIYQVVNNKKSQIMSLTLVSNQKVAGVLGLVDVVTGNPVTASFANVSATSDTPAAFTVSVDSSNNIDVVGVAAGSGTITVQADASYTDSTGAAKTETLTVTVDVVISAVIVADKVALTVTFGTPVAQ